MKHYFDQRDLSCLRLHEQLLHLIELQEAFTSNPVDVQWDDYGDANVTTKEVPLTELKMHTAAFRSAFEVHRLLFDEEYRSQYINTPQKARDLTINHRYHGHSQEPAFLEPSLLCDADGNEVVDSLRERGIDERSIAGEDELARAKKDSEITSDLLNTQQKGNI